MMARNLGGRFFTKAGLLNVTRNHRPFLVLISVAFFYLAFFAVRRHTSFHSTGFDLAVFDQLFWNTIHGRFWEFSLDLEKAVPHSYFANHFSPILFFLVPIYYLLPFAETLLIAQSLVLIVGAIPIYLFAVKILKSKNKATFIALVYFLSPFVQHINLFDFHEISFFIPLFGFCLLFLFEENWLPFWVFLILSLMVKEEVGLIGVGLGVFLMLRKEIRLGILVSAVSLVWSVATIKLIIPHFSAGDYKVVAYRYQDFGATTNQIIKNIALNPLKDLLVLTKPRKLYFLLVLFSSTGFVSLLGGAILILFIVPLLYLLLSSYQAHYWYTSQYSAVLIPTLFFTFVLGLKRLDRFKFKKTVYLFMAVIVLLSTVLFGALPFSRKFELERFEYNNRYENFEALKAKIPTEDSLAATDFVIAHLSQWRFLEFYTKETNADYVFLDVAGVNFDQGAQKQQIKLLENKGYRVVASKEGLCLLTKQKN